MSCPSSFKSLCVSTKESKHNPQRGSNGLNSSFTEAMGGAGWFWKASSCVSHQRITNQIHSGVPRMLINKLCLKQQVRGLPVAPPFDLRAPIPLLSCPLYLCLYPGTLHSQLTKSSSFPIFWELPSQREQGHHHHYHPLPLATVGLNSSASSHTPAEP